VSNGPFTQQTAFLENWAGFVHQWTNAGYGFIAFRFDNGSGIQYGWARIRMTGFLRYSLFKLVDYAYADPGEPITAGQTSSDDSPDQGSLGWLALGAAGLMAWRKSKSHTTELAVRA
jgi:hypothetical protein